MKEFSKFVGVDMHKETIAISVAEARGGEVRCVGETGNTPEAIDKLAKQLGKGGANPAFCREAGPCGHGIHRQLTDPGWDCQAVAPSLIPKKAGDRAKTGRRDSLMPARLHRAGELAAVRAPDGAREALRDLTRARGEAANIVKAQNLHRTLRRISDGHKREGGCVIPGEICISAEGNLRATDIERRRDACAEVSRGHSRCQHEQKGRTWNAASRRREHTDS